VGLGARVWAGRSLRGPVLGTPLWGPRHFVLDARRRRRRG